MKHQEALRPLDIVIDVNNQYSKQEQIRAAMRLEERMQSAMRLEELLRLLLPKE